MKKIVGIGLLCLGLFCMSACSKGTKVEDAIKQGFLNNDGNAILECYKGLKDQDDVYAMETQLAEAFKDENIRVLEMDMEELKASNYATFIFQAGDEVKNTDVGILKVIYDAPNQTISDTVDQEAKKLEATLQRRYDFEAAKKEVSKGNEEEALRICDRLVLEVKDAHDHMLETLLLDFEKELLEE